MASQKVSRISSLAFFDLETSGLSNPGFKPEIIELSILVVHRDQFQDSKRTSLPRVINKLTLCFSPKKPLRPQVYPITGLHNDELENQPVFHDTSAKLINTFLEGLDQPVCLIAHNGSDYDFPLIVANFKKCGVEMNSGFLCCDSLEAFRMMDEPDYFGPKFYPHIYNNHFQPQQTLINKPQIEDSVSSHLAIVNAKVSPNCKCKSVVQENQQETPQSHGLRKKRCRENGIADNAITKVSRKLEYDKEDAVNLRNEERKGGVHETSSTRPTELVKGPDLHLNQANSQNICGSDTESTLEYEWDPVVPLVQENTSIGAREEEYDSAAIRTEHEANQEHGRQQCEKENTGSLSDNELLMTVNDLEKEGGSISKEKDSKSGTQSSLNDSQLLCAIDDIELEEANNLIDDDNDAKETEYTHIKDGNTKKQSDQPTNHAPSTSEEKLSPQHTLPKRAKYKYNLGSLHERTVGYSPKDAHQAENDCLSMIRIFQKRASDVLPWIDKHAKLINEIKPMY